MNIEIANRLVELRKKSGLSQEELADKLGLSRQAVSKWDRAEASPDTDNLICLAKLYNVSLDDLLKTDVPIEDIVREQKEKEEEKEQAKEETKAEEPKDEKNKKRHDEVHISPFGIHVSSEDGDEVHISSAGIHIDDHDGTHVHLGKDNYKDFMKEKKVKLLGIISSLVTLFSVVAYLLVGFFVNTPWAYGADNSGWCVGWIIFFAIPIIPSIFSVFLFKRASKLAVPVIAAAIFLALGMTLGIWHPTWIIFFIIPIFYSIVKPIEHYLDEKNAKSKFGVAGDVVMDIKEDDEDEKDE